MFYNLRILVKKCKIHCLCPFFKFKQSSTISEKHDCLPEKLKIKISYFSLKFCPPFLLTNVCERVFMNFFFILSRSSVIDKLGFFKCVETRSFWFWQITQDLNKIWKKVENVSKISAKILNSMLVGARQFFHFFRQNAWFSQNTRALSKFLPGIWHY